MHKSVSISRKMCTLSSNNTLIIVQCGKKKIWENYPALGPVKAKDVYISNYFKLCARYAEKFSTMWVILSGKYGILLPDDIVESDYNKKLKPSSEFKEKVSNQLDYIISHNVTKVISLCGNRYARFLKDVVKDFGLTLEEPLDGMRIGKRQNQLKMSLLKGIPLSK